MLRDGTMHPATVLSAALSLSDCKSLVGRAWNHSAIRETWPTWQMGRSNTSAWPEVGNDRMRPVSRRHSRRGLVGGSTFHRTPISRSPLDKNPMSGHLSELHPVKEVNSKGQFFRASFGKKTPGSKYSSTSGLSPPGHLERQAEFLASTQDEA